MEYKERLIPAEADARQAIAKTTGGMLDLLARKHKLGDVDVWKAMAEAHKHTFVTCFVKGLGVPSEDQAQRVGVVVTAVNEAVDRVMQAHDEGQAQEQ